MKQVATALYSFFSSFEIPAFVESTEPDNTPAPYITYELLNPDWRADGTPIHARVWYRSTSFVEIAEKVDEIGAAIGDGISIPTESGAVYLYRDGNWAQMQPMEGDPTLKCAYLSLIIMAHTN